MQKYLLLFLLPFSLLKAQNLPTPIETKIEKVIVFRSGAQVIRKGKANLISGKSQLVFKGISPKINPQSIQVKGEGDFTVLSVTHQLNTLEEQTKRAEIEVLEQSQKTIVEKIQQQKGLLEVYKQEGIMLLKNQDIKGVESGLKTSDLREALDFHRQRQIDIQTQQIAIHKDLKEMGEQLGKINKQLLNLNQNKDLATGEVLITVNSKAAVLADFTLTYFVQEAAWYPTYDIRVKDIDKPLVIDYKANVTQASGEDWTEVKLTLSSADPNLGGQKPTIPLWYLQSYSPPSAYRFQPVSLIGQIASKKMVSGRLLDEKGEAIIGATVKAVGNEAVGGFTDENGYYSFEVPAGVTLLRASNLGYEDSEVVANQGNIVRLKEQTATLDMVVISSSQTETYDLEESGYINGNMLNVTPQKLTLKGDRKQDENKEVFSLVNEKANPTSVTFEIELPYTVPKDGKTYTVEIKENEINARYEYYCAPRFDKDAFLTAQIVGWDAYNLLSGETNLFFEGTYLGKGYLDLEKAGDTLGISLGRDKNVVITRLKSKDFSKNQVLGVNKTEYRAWDISIRHTKKAAIYLILEDQYPLSTEKEVEVVRIEHKEAMLNEETGKLTWKLTIEPNKERKIGFKYAVKSPKFRNFTLD